LEQRAGEGYSTAKTYWSSAQDLLEQRAGGRKPIGTVRRSFSQVIDFFWFFLTFFRPYPFNLLFNLKRQP